MGADAAYASGMVVVSRLLQMAVTWALLSCALFAALSAMPGDADDLLRQVSATERDRIAALRALDRPAPARLVCWWVGARGPGCEGWPTAKGALGGEWGHSRIHGRPVGELLGLRVPNTLRLLGPAFALALLLALGLGVARALSVGRALDRWLGRASFLVVAIPTHGLGLGAILLFALTLGLFPIGGVGEPDLASRVHHAALPVLVLTAFYAARWSRFLRGGLVEALEAGPAQLARAKGLPPALVVTRHGLRASSAPFVAVVSHSIPALFSGALVTERVFNYPGMGLLMFESLAGDDHFVAMLVGLLYAGLTMFAALAADLVHRWLDPRLRGEG